MSIVVLGVVDEGRDYAQEYEDRITIAIVASCSRSDRVSEIVVDEREGASIPSDSSSSSSSSSWIVSTMGGIDTVAGGGG
tara:strand:+ start:858 stop:1097 length:240 start_codon:yes stop_codon:yes gene_type:complete